MESYEKKEDPALQSRILSAGAGLILQHCPEVRQHGTQARVGVVRIFSVGLSAATAPKEVTIPNSIYR